MKNIGDRYDRLTIVADSGKRYLGGKIFICLCDCGVKKEIPAKCIGDTVKSCGCLRSETAKNMVTDMNSAHNNTVIGDCAGTRTSIYESWKKIINGCCRKAIKNKREPRVCREFDPRWLKFEAFLEDFGQIRRDQTISRINNKLPWSKENCFVNVGRRSKAKSATK